jgi:hypothetical protein
MVHFTDLVLLIGVIIGLILGIEQKYRNKQPVEIFKFMGAGALADEDTYHIPYVELYKTVNCNETDPARVACEEMGENCGGYMYCNSCPHVFGLFYVDTTKIGGQRPSQGVLYSIPSLDNPGRYLHQSRIHKFRTSINWEEGTWHDWHSYARESNH